MTTEQIKTLWDESIEAYRKPGRGGGSRLDYMINLGKAEGYRLGWADCEAQYAELVEAAEGLLQKIQVFTSGEMSPELRGLLYLTSSPCPDDIGRYVDVCEATDDLKAALAKVKGEANDN